MRNRSYSVVTTIIMLSLTTAFVACGPQNKMKTISTSKIFGDKSTAEEQLNQDIVGAATRKFDKDASAPSTKSAANSAKPTNGTQTQELATRLKYLNVKNIDGKYYLEAILADASGEVYDLVFSKPAPVVHKIVDGNPVSEESKLAVPVTASFYKDQNGLLVVTLSEDSKSVNAIIRTSGASVKLQQGQAETEDSKKLNNSSVTVRMIQLYYISQATRDANQIIPVNSPANKIFVQTGDQTKALLLDGILPAADDITSLSVGTVSNVPADEDLKKVLSSYELNIQNRGLLLQANSFQLILTGKDEKSGQVLGFDVTLTKRLSEELTVGKADEGKDSNLDLPPVGSGTKPEAAAAGVDSPKADFGNVTNGANSTAPISSKVESGVKSTAPSSTPKSSYLFKEGSGVLKKTGPNKL